MAQRKRSTRARPAPDTTATEPPAAARDTRPDAERRRKKKRTVHLTRELDAALEDASRYLSYRRRATVTVSDLVGELLVPALERLRRRELGEEASWSDG